MLRLPPCRCSHFYPRPPRGGRQDHPGLFSRGVDISIHALREEGDTMFASSMPSILNFYPRPPRGGRPARHRDDFTD